MCSTIDDLKVLPCSYIRHLVSYLDGVAAYHLLLLYYSILWPCLESSIIGFLSAPPLESEKSTKRLAVPVILTTACEEKIQKMNYTTDSPYRGLGTVDGIPHRVVVDCGSKQAYVVLTD